MMKVLLLAATHLAVLCLGIGIGIYVLPILTAPEGPSDDVLSMAREEASYRGAFRRDLADSDALHWGEGTLFVSNETVAFQGGMAPGPDYRLYFSPEFVETEAAFEALKSRMVQIGPVTSFDGFMLSVPDGVDPADFTTAIVWCEAFGQFISAAAYR